MKPETDLASKSTAPAVEVSNIDTRNLGLDWLGVKLPSSQEM